MSDPGRGHSPHKSTEAGPPEKWTESVSYELRLDSVGEKRGNGESSPEGWSRGMGSECQERSLSSERRGTTGQARSRR